MPARTAPLLLSLLAALPAPAAAGEPDADALHHLLGVSVALRADAVREDLLVPLSFSGPGVGLAGFYEGEVGPGLLEARLELGLRYLTNRFGHEAVGIDHGLGVSWVLPVAAPGGLRLAVGPAAGWETRVHYLASWDDAHAYWLGLRWLGASARLATGLGSRWRLEATPALALIGFAGRPPAYRYNKQDALESVDFYLLRTHEAPELFTLAGVQAARLRLAVRRAALDDGELADGFSFGLEGRLARAGDPATVIDLEASAWAAWAWGL